MWNSPTYFWQFLSISSFGFFGITFPSFPSSPSTIFYLNLSWHFLCFWSVFSTWFSESPLCEATILGSFGVVQGCLHLWIYISGSITWGWDGDYEKCVYLVLVVLLPPSRSLGWSCGHTQNHGRREELLMRGICLKLPAYWAKQQQKRFRILTVLKYASRTIIQTCGFKYHLHLADWLSDSSRPSSQAPEPSLHALGCPPGTTTNWAHLEIHILFITQISCLLLHQLKSQPSI